MRVSEREKKGTLRKGELVLQVIVNLLFMLLYHLPCSKLLSQHLPACKRPRDDAQRTTTLEG